MPDSTNKIKNIETSIKIRNWVQLGTTVAANAYVSGFKHGEIYTGGLKNGCVPFLNCYSCPGALFTCPIGGIQAMLSSAMANGSIDLNAIPYLIVGILMLIGTIVGRAVCGWLCPFGLFQDLLGKIPVKKFKGFGFLKYLKYIILLLFVIVLPMFWLDQFHYGEPTFCKYICPAGTIEGGIPLIAINKDLRAQIGKLFAWKVSLLVVIVILAVFIKRPFCRWLCPLGAFYGLFNKISIFKLKINSDECVKCGMCSRVCPVSLNVPIEINNAECLHCGECVGVCPKKCLNYGLNNKKNDEVKK